LRRALGTLWNRYLCRRFSTNARDSLDDVQFEARKISMSPYLVNISGHWVYQVISLEDLKILPAQHGYDPGYRSCKATSKSAVLQSKVRFTEASILIQGFQRQQALFPNGFVEFRRTTTGVARLLHNMNSIEGT
jgi:hypothetical protein